MPETDTETVLTQTVDDIPEDVKESKPLPDYPDAPFSSSESKLPAGKKERVKAAAPTGGRPRLDGMAPGTAEREIPIAIPRPKSSVFKSDADSPVLRSKAGWHYWNELPGWAKPRTSAYVYRDWPVLNYIDNKEEGVSFRQSRLPTKRDDLEFNYIDKVSGTEPFQDDTDLLHKYGCGSYHVRLNDEKGTLTTIWIMNLGGSDLKSYPPIDKRISDPEKQLDMTHPSNKSYIEFLRMRGVLPEQARKAEAEKEMATVEAIKELTGAYTGLVGRVMDKSEEGNKGGGLDREVMAGMVEMMKDTVQTNNEMTMKAVDRSNEILDAARKAAPVANGGPSSSDPMALALQIVQLINSGKGDSNEVAELRAAINRINEQRIESLERQLAARPTTPTATGPFSTVTEGVEALRKMREVVDEFSGGGGKGNTIADAAEEAVGDLAPKWLRPYLPVLGIVAQNMVQGYVIGQQRAAAGMGAAPAPIPPYPGAAPQPVPQPAQISGPQPVPQPQPQPVPTPDSPGMSPDMAEILTSMALPLSVFMHDEGADGVDFADHIYAGYGRYVFEAIVGAGAPVVLNTITTFPPMARRIVDVPRPRIEMFVHEFCTAKPGEETGGGRGENGAA